MKPNATAHPKFTSLVRWLRPQCGTFVAPETICVGLLERMWLFTAKNAPRGDIGKWSNQQIAEAMGWYGEAEVLIQKLVELRLLDQTQAGLIVHDWQDHAPNHVIANGVKLKWWAKQEPPKEPPTGTSQGATLAVTQEDAPTSPLLSSPSLSNPPPSPPVRAYIGPSRCAARSAPQPLSGSPANMAAATAAEKNQSQPAAQTETAETNPAIVAALEDAGLSDPGTIRRLAQTPGVSVALVKSQRAALLPGKGPGILAKAIADEAPKAARQAERLAQARQAQSQALERQQAKDAQRQAEAQRSEARYIAEFEAIGADERLGMWECMRESGLLAKRGIAKEFDPTRPMHQVAIVDFKREVAGLDAQPCPKRIAL